MQRQNWNHFLFYIQPQHTGQCFYIPAIQAPTPSYQIIYQYNAGSQQQQSLNRWHYGEMKDFTFNQNDVGVTEERKQNYQEPEEKFNQKIQEYQNMDRDRNLVSNSLKVLRKYAIDSISFKGSAVEKIIAKYKLTYSTEQFLRDLDKKIPKVKNYFGIKFLRTVLSKKNSESNFSIVFRTLVRYYYRKEVYPTVMTSKKILSQAKKKQIVGVHKFHDFL